MKQRSMLWQAVGFALVTFGGTILHFLYDWTSESILVSPFSGVNESTWEHMKLPFYPLFIFELVQRSFFKALDNYWCAKFAEILLEQVLIPVLFYTYNSAFGKSPDWINIAIFYITALFVFLLERCAFKDVWLQCKHPRLALAGICLIEVLFVVFTFVPPQISFFENLYIKIYETTL